MNRRLSDRHPRLATLERLWKNVVPLLALALALYAVLEVQAESEQVGRLARESGRLARENGRLARENSQLIRKIAREGRERRDQTCRTFERDARLAVKDFADARRRYRGTVRYLQSLPPAEANTTLNRTVRQALPRTRADVLSEWMEAKGAAAPPYCDKPGMKAERGGAVPVGLPEPNPRLPSRRTVMRLLNGSTK